MEKDERLLSLPTTRDLQPINQDYPSNYSPMNDDESFEQKRSVREYFNVVYKRLPVIVALTILTTAAVAFYMYKTPLIFQATTKMIIEPRKAPQTLKQININFNNDNNYYATQLLLLQSPALMRDVVVRLGLQREPNLFGAQNKGFISTVRSMFSGNKDSQNKETSLPVLTESGDGGETTSAEQVKLTPEEKQRAESYANTFPLVVEQVERTNLVNINVQSTKPDLAAKVADAVAELFIEQDIERETQGAKKNLVDLQESIEKLKGTIAQQDVERLNYLRSSGLPLVDGEKMRTDRIQTISGQWLAAIDERRKIEAKYDTVVRANDRGEGRSIPDVTESKLVQDRLQLNNNRIAVMEAQIQVVDKQIQDAQAKLSELRARYEDAYKENQAVIQQIDKFQQIRDKLQKVVLPKIEEENKQLEKQAVGGALTGLKSQLESAQKREAELQRAYQNELSSSNAQGQAETRLTTLTREIETNRVLLDTYTQRQKEQELTVAGSRPDNLIISSRAQTPTEPIGPKRNRNIFIAFLLSLAAGVGLAFLLDYLDDSVKTSDDVGRYLGLPTLALIPYQSANEKRKLSLASNNGNGNSSVALVALEDNRSAVAEAYRHLRTSLLFSSAGKPPQTILVTSSQPAEGKTTTAINTAITLAQSGAEVVIIDCDLRRPRLHTHFGLENSTGLTNYLSGDRNTENLLKPFPNLPQLKIITSGPIPPNPAELLSSNEMKNLLQFLKGNFQHVIIDSPPAISFTDAAILSTLVDGVVLVAMAGKSSVHLMRRFKQRLGNIGARIYGVVLNGVKANSTEYAYYGYGYTYNYYSPDSDDDSTPLMEDVVSVHKTEK